jgi:hypothetical protein
MLAHGSSSIFREFKSTYARMAALEDEGFFLPPRIEHTCLLCRQLWNFSRESVLQYSVITLLRSSIKWHQLSHVMIGAQWKQVFVWV